MAEENSQYDVTDEELVAYLDGELADGESAAVESRLADDPQLRDRAAQFAQTWDALEILTHDIVSEGFTEKTLQEVSIDLGTVDAGRNARKGRASSAREWRLAAVCFVAGVVGAAIGVGRPSSLSRMTPEEWEVVREMDQYKDGPSIQLLKSIVSGEESSSD